MPRFSGFSYRRRYNSLRLLGYDYNSVHQLCAITLVTDLRRPLFADINLAKAILTCLLSEQTLNRMRVRAFTLMPDHLPLSCWRTSARTLPSKSYWPIQELHYSTILEAKL